MSTLRKFLQDNPTRFFWSHADRNPQMDDFEGNHYRCTLTRRDGTGRRMVVHFSKGYGHNGEPPQLCEVLDCMASDAAGFENVRDFEEWCGEYGYDPDSRKAERTFKAIMRRAASLKRMFGANYQALLFDTERE